VPVNMSTPADVLALRSTVLEMRHKLGPYGGRIALTWTEFAADSPLEEGVLSELVSESKFPASTEYTGNSFDRSPAAAHHGRK
jgi:hypothetical protein